MLISTIFRRSQLTCALIALGLAAVLVTPASASSAVSVAATITNSPDTSTAGVYDYTITVTNTGEAIGTFWFGWVPGGNFLTPGDLIISTITEPAGWVIASDNNSIRFETTSTAGSSSPTLTFAFDSTETPAQMAGFSTVASGAFAGTQANLTAFAFASNSSSSTAVAANYDEIIVQPTPEPGAFLLALTGISSLGLGRFITGRRRKS